MRATHRGNAMVETIVALTVLSPFLGCIALLGKQLDVKHKSFDALRYSVWERTVWSGNAKSEAEVTMEALDRSFGDPSTGIVAIDSLRSEGVSRNSLWRHYRQPLLTTPVGSAVSFRSSDDMVPVDAGYVLVPGLAHGTGPVGVAANALRMDDLNLNRRSFASATIEANVRPLLAGRESPLVQRATGALLSDTWSPRDENEFGRRVDGITANELIEDLELPGRILSMQAPTKGGPLYGEGQYGWDPKLRPRSNALPSAYVVEREGE
ncbi:hypothetical protein GCM10011487_03140 [Steroidobacter agaridevorans]|uniref:Uncharacterized protein n=1 Tax=Steroidobacter agaridevorans TaxID=2695856 RepID=A0A829Y549_9GAMM|nr:hypothetical protein [Steroidobacter agaridevorans]GFE78314.1 hypothetical protein GCM10011487_03140 [Steroidobacter agaridevorans]